MKIVIISEVPDELVQEWLQHIRDFDVSHTGKMGFRVIAHDPEKTTKEIMEIMNINPPFIHKKVVKTN